MLKKEKVFALEQLVGGAIGEIVQKATYPVGKALEKALKKAKVTVLKTGSGPPRLCFFFLCLFLGRDW